MLLSTSRDGNQYLYIKNIDGTEEKRFTYDKGFDADMSFSPDGLGIVYESFVGSPLNAGIYVMDTDGSNRRSW